MDVIIVDTDLCGICNAETANQLKINVEAYFMEQLKALGVHSDCIRNIIIANMDNSYGRVDIVNYSPLNFNIFIHRAIIWYLFDEKQKKETYASAIIFHELFHCKDILNISSHIKLSEIECESKSLNDLFVNLGYHQYLEYRAHYYSAKINPPDIPSFIDLDSIARVCSDFEQEELFCKKGSEYITYNKIVHPFITKTVILLASISSQEDKCKNKLTEFFTNTPYFFNKYFESTNSILEELFNIEPENVRIEDFSKLGMALLDFKQ